MAEPDPKPPVTEPSPVEPPVPEPKSADPAPEPKAGDPQPEPKPAEPPKSEDWRDRRIAQLTARLREEQAKNAQTKTETKVETPPGLTEADVERRAAELAATQTFNRMCNDAAQAGRQAYPDFDSKVNELRRLVDVNDPASVAAYNSMLAAAIETGEAPRLLHELGSDLNEASRILALPALKMGVELTRLALGGAALGGTRAPKPITPVRATGAPHTAIDPTDPDRSDALSTAEWMRRRNAQLEGRQDDRRRGSRA